MVSIQFRGGRRGGRRPAGFSNVNTNLGVKRVENSPKTLKTIVTREFKRNFEFVLSESSAEHLDMIEQFPFDEVKRIISFEVCVEVASRVVVGDKYAANVAVGLRISDNTPARVGDVTALNSSEMISLPCKGVKKFNLPVPTRQILDLKDNNSELWFIMYAEIDKAENYTGEVGDVVAFVKIVYEPIEDKQWV